MQSRDMNVHKPPIRERTSKFLEWVNAVFCKLILFCGTCQKGQNVLQFIQLIWREAGAWVKSVLQTYQSPVCHVSLRQGCNSRVVYLSVARQRSLSMQLTDRKTQADETRVSKLLISQWRPDSFFDLCVCCLNSHSAPTLPSLGVILAQVKQEYHEKEGRKKSKRKRGLSYLAEHAFQFSFNSP